MRCNGKLCSRHREISEYVLPGSKTTVRAAIFSVLFSSWQRICHALRPCIAPMVFYAEVFLDVLENPTICTIFSWRLACGI